MSKPEIFKRSLAQWVVFLDNEKRNCSSLELLQWAVTLPHSILKCSHICLCTPTHQCHSKIQKTIREVTFNYRGIINLTRCWCISPELRKQTLVRTVKTSKMLLSVSPLLGLPATVACLRVFVRKDTPWDAKVPADDPSMQLQRLYVSMLQGNCLFGLLKSRKLVEGLFVRVCAPTEECRGTCPRRSATNHAVARLRLVHKHT